LGTGEVGKVLGSAFVELGHEVKMGSRTGEGPARDWARGNGSRASHGTFAEASSFGELVVLAVRGVAAEAVLTSVGAALFEGKVVIDTTNPLDFDAGMPPPLAFGHSDSSGERVQRLLPGARVVKAFNTVGSPHMFRPEFPGGRPAMFICGNDASAKTQVSALLSDFGWDTADIGAIDGSRLLEPMCLVWVRYGIGRGSFDHVITVQTR
jgi:predicted dinucleotide-binding enzyme